MTKMGLLFTVLLLANFASAQQLHTTVKDVTLEYQANSFMPDLVPTPTPAPTATPATTDVPTTDEPTATKEGGVDIGQLITLGEKIWDFIVSNKPNSEYQVLQTSIVPEGVTNWSKLSMANSKTIAKIYRVEFTNMLGRSAGGFDYRITYTANATYKGKGKFLGQISVVPMNVHLKTDRTLKMKAELLSSLNFGTEEDPIAGAQILVTWSTPTTTRYEMNSAEYLIHGTGEIEDLTNGN